MKIAIDTNVLVYIQDSGDPIKKELATRLFEVLITTPDTMVGTQVLGELYAALTKKLKQDPATAKDAVEAIATTFEPYSYRTEDVFAALNLASGGVLSYWDGLLVSAAERAGCELLISEDMHNGFKYGNLTVINPFVIGEINHTLIQHIEQR